MDKKFKSLLFDTGAFAISNFASKILTFLLIPLYTSVLSTSDYGIADLITNTINVIYPILTLNIMESTLRFAFDQDIDSEDVLINSLIFVVISEVFLIAASPIVKIASQTMYRYWIWFLLIFLGYNLQQILSQYVKGIGKTTVFAISGVVHTGAIITANIVGLLFLKLGLTAYLFSIVIGYAVAAGYLIVAGNVRIKKFKVNRSILKDMLKFSLPTIPNNIAWWVNTSADKYVIIAYMGVAASGIYSVAYKIPSILVLLSGIFTSAWTISVIQNVESKDSGTFQSKVYEYFNVANVIACSLLILLSQFLGSILYAKDFYIAWKCVPLLLVAYLFSGLAGFFASSFRATKYTKGLFSSTCTGAVANIVLNFYFVKQFGTMGAAFTTMIGFALVFYIRSYTVKKVVDIAIDIKRDSVGYLLLIAQAFIICLEVPLSYLIGSAILLLIFVLYRKQCISLVGWMISILKTLTTRVKKQS